MQAKPSEKLPVLYLMDSVIKNMKSAYLEAFTPNIVQTFCGVFEKVRYEQPSGGQSLSFKFSFNLKIGYTPMFDTPMFKQYVPTTLVYFPLLTLELKHQSSVHTSCECKCNINFDFTNAQQIPYIK